MRSELALLRVPQQVLLLLLLLLLAHRASFAHASTTSCCALSRTQLLALPSSPNCPSDDYALPVPKCDACPKGTCRVNDECVCPSLFLSSTRLPVKCEDSFGASWPSSVDQEDVDWRSCAPSFSPPPASDVSCCALSSANLTALRGTHPSCPDKPGSSPVDLSAKCQNCPAGMCRLRDKCLCPGTFLASSYQKSRCTPAFEQSWPGSIGKVDRAWRSCAKGFTPPPTTDESCCNMTEDKLNELRGNSGECPYGGAFGAELSQKCLPCPAGTCRVGDICRCPDYFLRSTVQKGICLDSFTVAWPASIGKEDREWRSCKEGHKPPPAVITSCCALSEEKLDELRGTSDDCPDSSHRVPLTSLCQLCPPGTCRVDMTCRCPESFLSESALKGSCEKSFGETWPLSIGKVDKNWESCNGKPPVSAPPTSTDSTLTTAATSATSTTRVSGAAGSPAPSSSSGQQIGVGESNVSGDSSNETSGSTDGNRLTTLEIVGIVAGVLSTAIAAGGLVMAMFRWKSKQRRPQEVTDTLE